MNKGGNNNGLVLALLLVWVAAKCRRKDRKPNYANVRIECKHQQGEMLRIGLSSTNSVKMWTF